MARNCGRGLSCGQAKLSSKFVNLQSHQLTHHWRHTNSNTILKIISIYSTPSSRLLREVSQWKVLQVFGLCVTTRGWLWRYHQHTHRWRDVHTYRYHLAQRVIKRHVLDFEPRAKSYNVTEGRPLVITLSTLTSTLRVSLSLGFNQNNCWPTTPQNVRLGNVVEQKFAPCPVPFPTMTMH